MADCEKLAEVADQVRESDGITLTDVAIGLLAGAGTIAIARGVMNKKFAARVLAVSSTVAKRSKVFGGRFIEKSTAAFSKLFTKGKSKAAAVLTSVKRMAKGTAATVSATTTVTQLTDVADVIPESRRLGPSRAVATVNPNAPQPISSTPGSPQVAKSAANVLANEAQVAAPAGRRSVMSRMSGVRRFGARLWGAAAFLATAYYLYEVGSDVFGSDDDEAVVTPDDREAFASDKVVAGDEAASTFVNSTYTAMLAAAYNYRGRTPEEVSDMTRRAQYAMTMGIDAEDGDNTPIIMTVLDNLDILPQYIDDDATRQKLGALITTIGLGLLTNQPLVVMPEEIVKSRQKIDCAGEVEGYDALIGASYLFFKTLTDGMGIYDVADIDDLQAMNTTDASSLFADKSSRVAYLNKMPSVVRSRYES